MNLQELTAYNSNTPLFAVIGDPIEHSVSPLLHKTLYETDGINADYTSLHITDDTLRDFTDIARKKLCGFNVTIPHKSAIIPYLDEVDETARMMNSVNTVKVINGRLHGYNTDILGVIATLEKNNIEIKGKSVCILGSGGASKSVVYALLNKGAEITVARRKNSTTPCFADDMPAVNVTTLDNLPDADIIINTTPVGMTASCADTPISDLPESCSFVFDVIYTPLETILLKKASEKGIKYENGLYMLLIQGVRADEIWLGRKISENAIKAASDILEAGVVKNRLAHRKKSSILLSGFMGCGKSTVGKALSDKLGFSFIDADAEIVKKAGMSINEIFEKYGEEHFRKLETDVLKELSSCTDTVIASGGGAMVKAQNFAAVKDNSLVIYMDADEDFLYKNISKSDERPLMKTPDPKARIHELLSSRKTNYEAHNHISINASMPVNEVVYEIMKRI